MKKALIVASALVLGSSVAMADSFSFGARASFSFGYPAPRPVVRDHRTPAPPAPAVPAYSRDLTRYTRGDLRWERPVIPAGLECRNWDPTVEVDSACVAYSTGYTYQPRLAYGWTLLGVRESAVADNQFVTVADGRWFNRLLLRAEQGSPVITKVAIRFMDSTTQVINLSGRLDTRSSLSLQLTRKPINQIVVYTAAGSHGTYSIAAR